MQSGQEKKPTSGLVILLSMMGIGALVVILGTGVVFYAIWRSPEGRGVLGIFGEVLSIQAKAQKAPGTKELRGMGCKIAMVVSREDLVRAMRHLDAGGWRTEEEDIPFGEMVVCGAQVFSTPPACEEVSKTYLSAVGPRPRPYRVSVNVQGKQKATCAMLFEGDGTVRGNADDPDAFGPVTKPPQ